MFLANSEEAYSDHESSYIVLFYEKSMRKRTFAKSQTQKQRIDRMNEVRRYIEMAKPPKPIKQPMILEELLPNRDSKMRRFCNYFLTLFNQKKLNPFTQFVHSKTLKRVKMHVRLKMQYFTKGVKSQVKSDDKGRSKRKKKDKKPKEIKGEGEVAKREEPKAQKLP